MKLMESVSRVLLLTVNLLPVANAHAQSGDPAGGNLPIKRQMVMNIVGKGATDKEPLTVQLKLTPSLRKLLRSLNARDMNVRLELQTLIPEQGTWSGFRVFLNIPSSDPDTSIESIHYVGSVAFYGGSPGEAATFALDLKQPIHQLQKAMLWRAVKNPCITLVPIPASDTQSAAMPILPIKKITVVVLGK